MPKEEAWFQWSRVGQYLIYYWIGYLFEKGKVREKVVFFFRQRHYVGSLALFSLTIALVRLLNTFSFDHPYLEIISFVQAIIGTLFIVAVSTDCVRLGILDVGPYKRLLKHNFEIYLYHEPLQFLVLFFLNEVGILAIFNSNIGYIALIVMRFLVSIILSICIGNSLMPIHNIFNRRCLYARKEKR